MTAMQFVEILSAALGLLGAALLASKSRFAGWAFVAWLVSNIGWIVFGAGNQHWFFIAQQVGFTATSVLGIWAWLIHPALRNSDRAADELERLAERAREHIDLALEIDFVSLVQGSHVLHTSAPVTFECLQSIYAMGEMQGRELERYRAGGRA